MAATEVRAVDARGARGAELALQERSRDQSALQSAKARAPHRPYPGFGGATTACTRQRAAHRSGAGAGTNLMLLPALTLACVSDGLLAEAVSVCDDARSALLRSGRPASMKVAEWDPLAAMGRTFNTGSICENLC